MTYLNPFFLNTYIRIYTYICIVVKKMNLTEKLFINLRSIRFRVKSDT